MQDVTFNYNGIDEELRKPLKQHAKFIKGRLGRAAQDVVEIGSRLNEVRKALGKHGFSAWLQAEFQWSQSVASNFMQVASKFGTLDTVTNFQPSALYALARKKTPEKALAAALKLAKASHTVTYTTANELIAKFSIGPVSSSVRPNDHGTTRPDIGAFRSSLPSMVKAACELPDEERQSLADELVELAMKLRPAESKPKPKRRRRTRTATATGEAATV